MNPEGVSYQYEFERFTTDERTQNIRLSSSLNDFRSARIPGNNLLMKMSHFYSCILVSSSTHLSSISRSRSSMLKKVNFSGSSRWSALVATRQSTCQIDKISFYIIQEPYYNL